MKILAIVVCYNPNIEELFQNIQKFINYVDKLIIWQNSENIKSGFLPLMRDEISDKFIFMGNGQNQGIAYPLNKAQEMMLLNQDNFTHLLTMDQDSTWQNFETYKDIINKYNENAIFSPNINNEIVGNGNFTSVKTCITSGAIFLKEVLEKIGKFNEEYSVDCVDYDFCFKAKDKGIPIIKINKAVLRQTYGAPAISKIFKIQNHVYSYKRLFFIARNHMLLWRDFPDHIDLRFKKVILIDQIFGKLVKVFLMEDSKYIKSKSIIKGFLMGLMNNRNHKY